MAQSCWTTLGISISKIWYVNVVPKRPLKLTWISQISICSRSYLCKTSIFQACETTNGNEWIINAEAAPPSLIRNKMIHSIPTLSIQHFAWLLDWLIDWPIDWLIDCLIDWLLDWFVRNVPFLNQKNNMLAKNPKLSKTNTQRPPFFRSPIFQVASNGAFAPFGRTHLCLSVLMEILWENVHHSWESNSKGRSTYSKIPPWFGDWSMLFGTVS